MTRLPDSVDFDNLIDTMRASTNRELTELTRRLDADLPIGKQSRDRLQQMEARVMRMDAGERVIFDRKFANELKKRKRRKGEVG